MCAVAFLDGGISGQGRISTKPPARHCQNRSPSSPIKVQQRDVPIISMGLGTVAALKLGNRP
jgi:hypothetical protein